MSGETIVLFSYVPLFRPPMAVGGTYDYSDSSVRSLIKEVMESEIACVRGCVWGIDPERNITLGLAMDRAREIGLDLMWWCEEDPKSWFNLHIFEQENKYHVALVPNVAKSVERLYANRAMAYGEAGKTKFGSHFVVFKPLEFISDPMTPQTTYRRMTLSDKISISLMEATTLSLGVSNLTDADVFEIGVFDIHKTTYVKLDAPKH